MVTESTSYLAREQQLDELIAAYLDQVEAGGTPNQDEWLDRHPEFKSELTAFFADRFQLERLAAPLRAIAHPVVGIDSPGQLGDFRLVREIGRGGMGVVYEAEQLSIGRRVALKVLPFAAMLDKQQLNRFKNEARAAGTLDHPNIVAIYSVGVERSVHFYAMQLIEGQSLAQVIEHLRQSHLPLPPGEGRGEGALGEGRGEGSCLREGQVGAASRAALSDDIEATHSSPARLAGPTADTAPIAHLSTLPDYDSREYFRTIAQLGIQAAEALDHAHQNGILHRDIKPANLLIDDTGKLWITDFGLARMEADAGMTMTGDILGTLRYMSPEQALAKRVVVDHRSDIYSLGVTLYELLTLQPAFTGDDRHEILRQIAFEEPRSLRQINDRIPSDLETIIAKSIEKNPSDRYAIAHDLADDLRRFLCREPIRARSSTPLQRLTKWSRRHVAVVWSAALVLLISTLVLVAANIRVAKWYRESERNRELANRQLEEAQRQEKSAMAVSTLLQQMLASSNPDQMKGPDYTVRQLLDDFSDGMHDQLTDQPVVEATLRSTVAQAYRRLGMRNEAESNFKSALRLWRSTVGPNDPRVATTLVDFAWCLGDLSKNDEAIRSAQEALAIYRANGGTREQMLNAYSALHQFYVVTFSYESANATADEALAFAGDLDAADIPAVADLLHNIARSKAQQEDLPAAIDAAKRSVELHRRLHGPTHPQTAWGLTGFGWMLHAHGELAESEAAQREALAIFRRYYGREHKSVQWALLRLADVRRDSGDLSEFKSLVEEAAAGVDEAIRLGRAEPTACTWFASRLLDKWRDDFNNPELAVRLAQYATEIAPKQGNHWRNLGIARYRIGNFQAALDALQKSAEITGSIDVHANFIAAMSHQKLGNTSEARELYTETVARINANLPDINLPIRKEAEELFRRSTITDQKTESLKQQGSIKPTADD